MTDLDVPAIPAGMKRRRRLLDQLARRNRFGNMPTAELVVAAERTSKARGWTEWHLAALIDLGLVMEWDTPAGPRLLVTPAGYNEINGWESAQ